MENKYKTFAEFRKDYPNEYAFLYKKGLVNKFREDMGWEIKKNKPNYWNLKIIDLKISKQLMNL